MEDRFRHAPLLSSHALSRGLRVRLRLAQVRDVAAIQRLVRERCGMREELEVAQLVRMNPRRRIVICASALIGTTETLVGVAAMDVDADEPDLLCVDEVQTDDLADLLRGALVARANAIAARRAA